MIEVIQEVESDHRDRSGRHRLPKAANWGKVPRGLSKGAPCPHPRVVRPHELLHKRLGIQAFFFHAPLPRRPCMGEPPCKPGGGIDSSKHQFPRQTDQGQDTEVITHMCRQVDSLTLGLTVADRREFASGNWPFSLVPSGSQPQAQSRTHGITSTICT